MGYTEEHILRALTMMIKDAQDKWEVAMIGFYFRNPKQPTELSPMGQSSFQIISTQHIEFDRFQFEAFVWKMMPTLDMKDVMKRSKPPHTP